MKKLICVTVLILLFISLHSQEENGSLLNSVNFVVNDITKIDISYYSGDISYSRVLSKKWKANIGISGLYDYDITEEPAGEDKLINWGIGLSLSLTSTLGNDTINPYYGFGIYGSFDQQTMSELVSSTEKVHEDNIFLVSIFTPFGIEYTLSSRVVLSLGSKVQISYHSQRIKAFVENVLLEKSTNDGYGVKIENPEVVISILF